MKSSTATNAAESFKAQLLDACATMHLSLDAQQVESIEAYVRQLNRWNAAYNLTAVRDVASQWIVHVLDCLAIIAPLQDALVPGATVIDVGSGGGLPGVLIAIAAPQVQVHCVDAVGKKTAFLTQLRGALKLDNLHAHHARVEQLRSGQHAPAADLIVSRAFSSLADFVRLTDHLRAPGGRWCAMKGVVPHDEIAALPPGVRVNRTLALHVPHLDAERHLLFLDPIA